jgi:hypothetical protein
MSPVVGPVLVAASSASASPATNAAPAIAPVLKKLRRSD